MNEIGKITESLREKFGIDSNQTPTSSSDALMQVANQVFQKNSKKVDPYRIIPLEEVYTKLNDGTFVAKYDTYVPGEDNAELNAKAQSTGEKWSNGLLKLVGKTATAIVGGTVGQVAGIVDLIRTGTTSSLYDNEFARKLDDINVTMDNKLPNYYTKEEQDMGVGSSMLTANFWANDVLSGLSFTLGAIGTELVWGGLTGGASIANTATRLSFMSGVKKMGKDLVKGSYKDFPLHNISRATNIGKTASLLNTARFAYTSAGYEAGVEAFQFTKEMREGFYQDFLNKNGRAPEKEDYETFYDNLTTSANTLYSYNLALVGTSNLVTIGRLFDSKTPRLFSNSSDWVNKKMFGVGITDKTKFQKIARLTYGLGKAPVTEGIYEEGLQGVGSSASEAWVKSKYDPKYSKESLSIGDAFYEGLAETYGTKEGWKGIAIGMIIGGISGTGVNIATRKNEFTEADQRASNQKAFQENYSGNQFMQALGLANRTQKLTEEYENANSNTGQEMARKGQILNQLSYAYEMDSLDSAKEDTLTSIEAVDVEILAKERGITVEEATQFKEGVKEDYLKTFDSYKKYRDFAEYFIGDKLRKSELEYGTSKEIKDAMAYQLAMGENSYNYSQEILSTLKQELAGFQDALDLNDLINNSQEETKKEFSKVKNEIQELERRKTELDNKRKSLSKLMYGSNTETNAINANELNIITQELAELVEKESSLNFKLNNLVKASEIENPFNTSKGRVVTNEQLLNIDKTLSEINSLPEKLAKTDIQKAQYLNALIDEYGTSVNTFKQYADISRQITSGDLQLFGGKIRKIFQGKEPNEVTTEFLAGLSDTMAESNEQRAQDLFMTSTAVQEVRNADVIETEEIEEPIVPEESLLQRIVRNNPYLQTLKEGIRKPNEEDVIRFQTLSAKALYDENVGIFDEVEIVESDALTEEESQELEALRELLSNWQLYDGITEEGVKLSEVLEQEAQNKTEPAVVEEQPITTSEILEMADPDYTSKELSGKRPENVSQTAQNVQVKRDISDNATVHNISLPGFLENVNLPIFDEDGVEVMKTAIPNEIGTKLRVGESSVSINSKGVIEVKGFQHILDNSDLKDFRYSYGKTSGYSFLYEDGKLKSSDFDVSDFNFEAIYDLQEGDELFLRVESDMEYNQSLSEEQLEAQLSISIVDSKGNKVGVLKSNQDVYGKDENFNLIRKRAVEVFKKGGGLINAPVTVEYTFLGTPNFEMEGNAPKEQPLPVDSVLDWGYYDGKNFNLVNGTKNVRGTFIAKINKKVPVVVFKRGNQIVAFPVELKGVPNPMGAKINEILLNGASVSSSVIEVNNLLLENGRKGDLYFLSPTEQNIFTETGEYTQVVKDHIEAMDQIKTFPDISNVSKENLPESIAIAINIGKNPITSPKIVMKFGEPSVSEEVLEQEKPAKKVEKVLKKITTPKEDKTKIKKDIIVKEDFLTDKVHTENIKDEGIPKTENLTKLTKTPSASEALTKEAKIIKEEPKGDIEVKATEKYTSYTFKESSSKQQFQALIEDGDRVIGPTDFYVATKGMLKSDKGGPLIPYPTKPSKWLIVKNKLETPISNTLKGRSRAQQNKKC